MAPSGTRARITDGPASRVRGDEYRSHRGRAMGMLIFIRRCRACLEIWPIFFFLFFSARRSGRLGDTRYFGRPLFT